VAKSRIVHKPPTCQQCGKSIGPRRSNEQITKWLARQFCSRGCADAAKRKGVAHGPR
jgi:hypothetical protein